MARHYKKGLKLGEGGRFEKVEKEAAERGARDPKAVAAAVGRRKYGAKEMTRMATRGRHRASMKRHSRRK